MSSQAVLTWDTSGMRSVPQALGPEGLGWFLESMKVDCRIGLGADSLSYFRPVCYAVQNGYPVLFELGISPLLLTRARIIHEPHRVGFLHHCRLVTVQIRRNTLTRSILHRFDQSSDLGGG